MNSSRLPTVSIPIFRKGISVEYQGFYYTVNYVVIQKDVLMVFLEGKPDPVNAKELSVQLSKIDFEEQRLLRDQTLK